MHTHMCVCARVCVFITCCSLFGAPWNTTVIWEPDSTLAIDIKVDLAGPCSSDHGEMSSEVTSEAVTIRERHRAE